MAGHGEDPQRAEAILTVARKLRSLIRKVSPETTTIASTSITSWWMTREEITAVRGWEYVSALPLWMSTHFPRHLDEPVREDEPQRDAYMPPGDSGNPGHDIISLLNMDYNTSIDAAKKRTSEEGLLARTREVRDDPAAEGISRPNERAVAGLASC